MPSLDELRYFHTVVKTLNVSRAAELAGVSQPALSHALRRLEDELGILLLFRTKTGVRLTRAGERFALQSKELIDRWESLSKDVQTTDHTVSGLYKIGCHQSVAIYSLPLFLSQLLQTHADLQIRLVHGLSREIASEVIEWKIDFGLVINPPPHPDLVIRDLGSDEVTLWESLDNKVQDTLMLEPNLLQTQSLIKQLEKKKIFFRRRIESPSLEVIHALTIAGAGVGILPSRVAKNPMTPSLRPFSSKAPIFRDRLCLIYRAGTQSHASGRVIIDAILKAKI